MRNGGDLEKAVQYLTKAIHFNGDDERAFVQRSRLVYIFSISISFGLTMNYQFAMHKYNLFLLDYNLWPQHNFINYIDSNILFRCNLKLGRNDEAIEDAQEAVNLVKDSIPALETLGIHYLSI